MGRYYVYYGFMMVFNSKKKIHVSVNSGHLQVITILFKDYHILVYAYIAR